MPSAMSSISSRPTMSPPSAPKSMGIKMVLSGEGADEIFGGYLYFHKAPSAKDFHEETVRKLSKLHLYDCLRANKSLSAWGVEGRVPFLDKEFLDVAMRTNPKAKMCPGKDIEKRIVREAFADLLPAEVAWRQKEQFSDGVGYSWIDTLKAITAAAVSDDEMAHAAERFPINPPKNKEEYYYRSIFTEHFPSDSAARSVPSEASVACSTAIALEWDKAFAGMNDPSQGNSRPSVLIKGISKVLKLLKLKSAIRQRVADFIIALLYYVAYRFGMRNLYTLAGAYSFGR